MHRPSSYLARLEANNWGRRTENRSGSAPTRELFSWRVACPNVCLGCPSNSEGGLFTTMHRWLILLVLTSALAQPASDDRISLKLDTSEADAVLAILNANAARQPVTEKAWQRLFASEPYQRLKKPQSSMRRDLSDHTFEAFVLSPEIATRRETLSRNLAP